MAIYRFSAQVVSRGRGQSVIACAAYRSGDKLHDDRTGELYDYTKKQDVAFEDIMLPEAAPEWMADRQKLWNAVELSEKRKDAQLAREVQLALPRELSVAQNIELTRGFVKEQFVSKGMIADIAIHVPRASDGDLQPHAHVLLTMRAVSESGFGHKARNWNQKCELQNWREAWCDHANKHLALNGFDIKIDHRSLADQGIDLEPQKKVGTASAYHRMAAYKDHVAIAERNGEKLMENPGVVLDIITRQQSTFTHHDLARIVNRHTASVDQFQTVFEKVKASDQLVYLGQDNKKQGRYSTKDMIELEGEMIRNATTLASKFEHGVGQDDIAAATSHGLSTEQTKVLHHIVAAGDLRNVIGYAGSGKSRLLGAAKDVWESAGYRVLGASLSGIAAENLEASSGIESRTLASRFYYWDRGQELLGNKDVLVIDEAGMLGSRQLGEVLEEVTKRGAKVVMVGDPEQLQAIEAGAAFRAITEKTSYIELTEIWRQKESWQKEATIQFATNDSIAALTQYEQRNCIHEFDTQAQAKEALVDSWNDVRISDPNKSLIMLTYKRDDAKDLNLMARSLRLSLGELGEEHQISTARGERLLSDGDRIYFLKNDRDLGVKNGTLGTIIGIRESGSDNVLAVKLDKENEGKAVEVEFSLTRYRDIDYGYAATIHKGQGVTVDNTFVLASQFLDRHSTYVAMTRHRDNAELFWSKEAFNKYSDMVNLISRERTKDTTNDYSISEYGNNRNIHKDDLSSLFTPSPEYQDRLAKDLLGWQSAWAKSGDKYLDELINHTSNKQPKSKDIKGLLLGSGSESTNTQSKTMDKDIGDDGMDYH